ncbi:hypothetical protein EDD17DRAFT_1801038 [Pisolithus thermaeus]|nr:hypothetical protein EDD17DRAFT_1801038 [Pisolithus thermaeus]
MQRSSLTPLPLPIPSLPADFPLPVTPPPPSPSTSSTSSGSFYLPVMSSTTASQNGRCEQPAPSKAPPVLTAGDITPEALHAWELGCLNYFRQKGTAAEDQVAKVAGNLLDPRIQDWYSNNGDHLMALSFAEFMTEKMLSSTQETKPFHLWAVEIESLNVLLCGSESYLSEVHLRFHLESHMNADLAAEYRMTLLAKETNFHAWLDMPFQPSRVANTGTTAKTDGKLHTHIPPLTVEEHQLLKDNSGCFKCRRFFQTHTTPTCPNEFPEPKGYKTLTIEDVEAARKKRAKPVAAVIKDEPAPKRPRFTEVKDTDAITVVMPSAALGSGSESEDECVTPFSTTHFRWPCLLDGPNTSSSLHVNVLIDNGSHLVLIDEKLVNQLGLQHRHLSKPFYEVHKLKEAVMDELRWLLPEYKELVDQSCDPVQGVNVIAAVQQRIEELALLEELRKQDARLKTEFVDHFPLDIPPTDSLPDDVLFQVQPKDVNKIIQLRSYDCPKKYREAWKTLLQQHLDTGHLRPSNSQHSSPAFIIPKHCKHFTIIVQKTC